MNQINEVNFDFENNKYRIFVIEEKGNYKIVISRNGRPLPWTYSVDFDIAYDFLNQLGEDTVNSLIQLAKSDIIEKRFESILSALNKD